MQDRKQILTVQTSINAPLELVWSAWTQADHITHWNFASDDWCCPRAVNNLQPGSAFHWRMEAKDGSLGFDFEGTYHTVRTAEYIEYTIADGRRVKISFSSSNGVTTVSETFEAETTNSLELQQTGWQCILDNFKKYTESMTV